MAIATFGNFQVDMTNPDYLDAILGNNFDGFPGVTQGPTEITESFPSGARAVLRGNFTLGLNSTIEAIEVYNPPGNVFVFSIVGLTGVTVGRVANLTFDQLEDLIFGQVNEGFTQGFDDILIGDASNEIAHSGAGNDVIRADGGNDILDGEAGADTMEGGTGNDIFYVDNAGDRVVELAGQGTDTVRSIIAHVLASHVERLELLGTSGVSGTGNELDNVIVGNAGDNALAGEGGNDTLDGAAGADAMTGGAGDDRYLVDNAGDTVTEVPGGGFDTVETSVSRTIDAGVERMILVGSATAATGNSGENTLTGSAGDNTLDGGRGGDVLAGGLGNDSYQVDNSLDQINETAGQGDDSVTAGISFALPTNLENLTLTQAAGNATGTGNAGNNVLDGNARDNVLDGGAGNDILRGHGGEDLLIGGAGDDRLSGGAGRDTLFGDAGVDRFVFDSALAGGANADRIVDFAKGQDFIELSTAIFASLGAPGTLGASDFVSAPGAAAQTASHHVIHDVTTGMLYYDTDGSETQGMVAFAQVNPGQALAATDFHVIT